MLNVEKTKKWTRALRSGRYLQGKNSLISQNDEKVLTYCCLGVYCEITNPLGWQFENGVLINNYWQMEEWDPEVNDSYDPDFSASVQLPVKLMNELGLSAAQQDQLIRLNDSEQKSFLEIADYLDRELAREAMYRKVTS